MLSPSFIIPTTTFLTSWDSKWFTWIRRFQKHCRCWCLRPRGVPRGQGGNNASGAELLVGAEKSQQCRKFYFHYSTFATWERQTCFLPRVRI